MNNNFLKYGRSISLCSHDIILKKKSSVKLTCVSTKSFNIITVIEIHKAKYCRWLFSRGLNNMSFFMHVYSLIVFDYFSFSLFLSLTVLNDVMLKRFYFYFNRKKMMEWYGIVNENWNVLYSRLKKNWIE